MKASLNALNFARNMEKPKKQFGQNFLINDKISQTIVNYENIEGNNILEIGPGNLALTKHILKYHPKKLASVEIDKSLKIKYPNDILDIVFFEDAMKFDERSFFQNQNFSVISNLPFNISSQLLIKWIYLQNNYNCINSLTLMFQKEMGERIMAEPNTKKYGRLTIITKAYFEINKMLLVNKKEFSPQPKIDGIVLQFKPLKKNKIARDKLKQLEFITSIFFNGRRKKNKKKFEKLFNKIQISKNSFFNYFDKRAEDIEEEVFYKMSEIIKT